MWFLKLLGAVGGLVNWFLGKEQQKIGMDEQKLADDQKTLEGVNARQEIEQANSSLSDAAIRDKLR